MFTLDGNGNLVQQQDPLGRISTMTWDELNRQVKKDLPPWKPNAPTETVDLYDGNGNLVSDRQTNQPQDRVHNAVYDALNRPVQRTDSLGNTTTLEYDAVGNLTRKIDPLLNTTNYAYDARNRLTQPTVLLNRVTSPARQVVTTYGYDLIGNRISEQLANGDAVAHRRGTLTTHAYDPEGRLTQTTKAGVTLATLQYDPAGNRRFVTDANGNTTGYLYDERNLETAEQKPLAAFTTYTLDNMGDRATATDPENRLTTYTHDLRRRLTTETDNAGDTTSYTYDGNGNRTAKQRPAFPGLPWVFTYDGANRLTAVQDPLGDRTTYAYDLDSNRLSTTDAESQTTARQYDALNRATQKTYPDRAQELYTYDPNGNRLSLQDADGQTIGYAYDEIDRQVLATYPAPTPATADDLQSIAFTYDPNNNPTAVQEAWSGNPTVRTTAKIYDPFDRLISVTDRYGLALAYTYDPAGNRTSLQDPNSNVTRYAYDALNRLSAVTMGGAGGGVTSYAYLRDSRLQTVTYPNGTLEATTYDAVARIQVLENRLGANTVLSHFEYQYDPDGNRTNQFEVRATSGGAPGATTSATTTYTYDAADRLTHVAYPDQLVAYTYDKVGDRLTETAATPSDNTQLTNHLFTYNTRHQLTTLADNLASTHSLTYTYDPNGNQISRTQNGVTTTFQFDVRDQLTTVLQGPNLLGAYEYDYKGLRILKQGAQGYLRYLYDDKSVLLETDVNNQTLAKYDYGPDRLLALTQQTEGRSFYLFDALGSVTDLTTSTGSLRATYQYDAWGNYRATTGGSFNAFGFTGHERDTETGLYYFKARFYDPAIGRFLTEDPVDGHVENPPSLHRYLYAYVNPTLYTDPDGRWPSLDDIVDVAKAAVVAITKTQRQVVSAAGKAIVKAAVNGIDLATGGSVSALQKQVAAFQATQGSLAEKLDAAGKVDTLAERAHVLTLGFSDALDKTKHLKDLTGVSAVEKAGQLYAQAYEEGDVNKALQATGDLSLGFVQLGLLAEGGARLGGKVLDSIGPDLGGAVSEGINEGAVEGVADLRPRFPALPPATIDSVTTQETAQAVTTAENAEGAGVQAGVVDSTHSVAPVSSGPVSSEAGEYSAPVGRTSTLGGAGNHTPQLVNPPYQVVRNAPATIGGLELDYSGHALDQMQNRGFTPTVVENTRQVGQPFESRGGTVGFFDPDNNIRVILNYSNGRVVTVIPGAPK